MSKEAMKLALKRAFVLGQDYWYQADHESHRQNKKADETLAKFRQLVDETCEALAKPDFWEGYVPEPVKPAQQEPVEYWTVADGWVSEQAEVPAAVWVEPDFWEHCNRVNCGTAYRLPAPGRQPLYTSPPAQRKPLTPNLEADTGYSPDQRAAFKAGWEEAEAAHNIKEQNT